MTDIEQPPPQNGVDLSANEEEDHSKSRPADIEQDMREMERRKRVEAIMGSKLFREELERIVDSARDGGTSGILQQLSDIVGLPASRIGSVYKASNCLMPINDIRGVESMGYAKGEKILRCKLAATFRLLDLYGWTQGLGAQITARLKVDQEYFLVNPYGLLYHEITASSLNKVDMQGNIIEQGTTNFGVNKSHFILHSVVHAARPDIRCAIYIGCSPVVAVSSLKTGLLPITKDACVLGEISTHPYTGSLDTEERDRLIRNLGPNSKVMLLSNHGALCCGETIEEAFYAACHIVQACETQLKLLPVGLENLSLIPEEARKIIYEQSRRPPEDLEKKFAAAVVSSNDTTTTEDADTSVPKIGATPKWRVGGAEFEALMRMLDNAGYRTGYIYRHPLIKSDPPKPKNDVELPPAVSSLGYLLEEEELFRQGIWKKGDLRKGGDRSRWLNSPNVYQKVEVLETGTPDPKKITKWVAEGSPTHSTPVRIEDPLQFVPAGTNPKEFKRVQQLIKDNRRADKISAGPQSHILEGVTWDEANRIRDATVSATGDHVVLMGAASKGIIQRGFQHNATVYKAPYAKNPFDNVTDDELNEYKRTVERKKKSIHGEYTDTDFSESEALSSLPATAPQLQGKHGKTAGATQSEPEDMGGAHQVMRIETQQAPVPSQPEVVLSDATLSFLNGERTHTAVNRKPPTGRATEEIEIRTPIAENIQMTFKPTKQDFVPQSVEKPEEENPIECTKFVTTLDQQSAVQANRERQLFAEMEEFLFFRRQNERANPVLGHAHDLRDREDRDNTINRQEEEKSEDKRNDNNCPFPVYDSAVPSVASMASNTYCSIPNIWEGATWFMPNVNRQISLNSKITYTRKLELNNSTNIYNSSPNELYANMHEIFNVDKGNHQYMPSLYCENPIICSKIFNNIRANDILPTENDKKKCLRLTKNCSTESKTPLSSSSNSIPTKQDLESWNNLYIYTGRGARRRSTIGSSKNIEPYRTVSHFGFNSPQFFAQPEHKHIPAAIQDQYKKYIALHKSVSYDQIFSSPRYMDLCENCFEKAVRLSMRFKNFDNIIKSNPSDAEETAASTLTEITSTACTNSSNQLNDNQNGNPPSHYESIGNGNELSAGKSLTKPLEPLIEEEENSSTDVEEINSYGNANNILGSICPVGFSTADSTFLEKVMRMNYSEESANPSFIPHPVTSSISISRLDENEPGSEIAESKNSQQINLTTDNAMNKDVSYKNCQVLPAVCLTEILEFGDWQNAEKGTEEEHLTCDVGQQTEDVERQFKDMEQKGECNKEKIDGKIVTEKEYCAATEALDRVEEKQNHSTNSEFKDSVNELAEKRILITSSNQSVPSIISSASNNSKNSSQLMNRSERYRRKSEFQELWEDHLAFFKSKERHDCSDTEEIPLNDKINNPSNKGKEEDSEVFLSRSTITRQQQIIQKVSPLAKVNDFDRHSSWDENFPSVEISQTENTTTLEVGEEENPNSLGNDVINSFTDHRKALQLETDYRNFFYTNNFRQRTNLQSSPINYDGNNNDNNASILEEERFDDLESREVVFPIEENKLTHAEGGEIFDSIQKIAYKTQQMLEKQRNQQEVITSPSIENLEENKRENSYEKKLKNILRNFGETISLDSGKDPFKSATEKGIKKKIPQPHKDNDDGASKHQQSSRSKRRRSRSIEEFPLVKNKANSSPEAKTLKISKETVNTSPNELTEFFNQIWKGRGSRPANRKRNFIVENIRNVANAKRKRNLCADATPHSDYASTPPSSRASTPCNEATSFKKMTSDDRSPAFSCSSSTTIYPFQSKIVGGSPRFWVSLPGPSFPETTASKKTKLNGDKTIGDPGIEMPFKEAVEKNNKANKKKFLFSNNACRNKGDILATIDTPPPEASAKVETNTNQNDKRSCVDIELDALSNQIQLISPRIDNIKRQCEKYGEQVAKCSQTLDECMELQQDVYEEQLKLHKDIALNQYAEQILCRANTFSISETED